MNKDIDEMIYVVKKAIGANINCEELDSNDIDHMAEEVAEEIYKTPLYGVQQK